MANPTSVQDLESVPPPQITSFTQIVDLNLETLRTTIDTDDDSLADTPTANQLELLLSVCQMGDEIPRVKEPTPIEGRLYRLTLATRFEQTTGTKVEVYVDQDVDEASAINLIEIASRIQFFISYPQHMLEGTMCLITGKIVTFDLQNGRIRFNLANSGICI